MSFSNTIHSASMLEARQALLTSRNQLLVILEKNNNHALKQLSTRAEKLTRSFDNFKRIGEAEFKIADLVSALRQKRISELEAKLAEKAPKRCVTFNDVVEYRYF